MSNSMPEWLSPAEWIAFAGTATESDAVAALQSRQPDEREFASLIAPAAAPQLEAMAQRAQQLTRHHFGNTVSLYAPLYLSNFCSGGCAYCGFAADREQPRFSLSPESIDQEIDALMRMGFDDILLLTGERCPQADVSFVRSAVCQAAAKHVDHIAVETFAMEQEEYASLVEAGCSSVTLYQETYEPVTYEALHRWGPKRDYADRLDAPGRALAAGMRSVGIGALFGLADPLHDAICVFQHARHLQRTHWRSGVSISFPRICAQRGDYTPAHVVSDAQLAQFIFAFRICLPDVPLVLSTRETPALRDGLAGVGISRMSAASRTTVGGYVPEECETGGQFSVSDTRSVDAFCLALQAKGLDPVFKNWDSVFLAPGSCEH
jgi:2-iminoacetate synthase